MEIVSLLWGENALSVGTCIDRGDSLTEHPTTVIPSEFQFMIPSPSGVTITTLNVIQTPFSLSGRSRLNRAMNRCHLLEETSGATPRVSCVGIPTTLPLNKHGEIVPLNTSAPTIAICYSLYCCGNTGACCTTRSTRSTGNGDGGK